MNFDKVYEYRFKDVDQVKKIEVWSVITKFIEKKLENPKRLLDPAAGRCEFINLAIADEKYAIDMSEEINKYKSKEIKTFIGNLFTIDLPQNHFDAIFVSNLLEHFANQTECAKFLDKMRASLKDNALIFIMGPNFKYCAKDYFDCSDHTLILTHISVEELLYASGFKIEEVVPQFIPFSFRGRLPPSKILTALYLKMPFAWKFFGKQFYLLARKTN